MSGILGHGRHIVNDLTFERTAGGCQCCSARPNNIARLKGLPDTGVGSLVTSVLQVSEVANIGGKRTNRSSPMIFHAALYFARMCSTAIHLTGRCPGQVSDGECLPAAQYSSDLIQKEMATAGFEPALARF